MKTNNKPMLLQLVFIAVVSLAFTIFLMKKGTASAPVIEPCTRSTKSSFKDPLNVNKIVFYDNYIKFVIASDNKSIDLNTMVEDTSLKKIRIGDLVKQKKTLVFRYAWNDCDVCVGKVLEILKNDFKKNIGLLILTDSYSEKDFLIKARNSPSVYPVHMLPSAHLGLPLENKSLPFLFVLSKEGTAEKIFIPFKEHPENIKEYIKYINSDS